MSRSSKSRDTAKHQRGLHRLSSGKEEDPREEMVAESLQHCHGVSVNHEPPTPEIGMNYVGYYMALFNG